jgi:putative membrane protein insertion efficiency factor
MSEPAAAGQTVPQPWCLSRIVRTIAIAPIVVYQHVISPAIPQRCKYEPTCSRYAVGAIREYGILRGLVLAGWRLLRCNPWSLGGYDPVEAQRVFRAGRPAEGHDHDH